MTVFLLKKKKVYSFKFDLAVCKLADAFPAPLQFLVYYSSPVCR